MLFSKMFFWTSRLQFSTELQEKIAQIEMKTSLKVQYIKKIGFFYAYFVSAGVPLHT